ncbi:hypothetical protein B7R22_14820 [Subtercola boreus]|uniref:HTH luxR-type domain-containing protein n=1 Tax=Subtercola boreus TaxID=120213 RepID=A0A3E0VS46_9MICO|nr:helix-turn-helix transcriptional regulator [Subtercola boreus]RFA12822.1 hypothetical protein B7R22_14820 [Subtercola boreus]
MPSLQPILRMLVEPVLAGGLFCFWYAANQPTIVTSVPGRSDLAATNPYAVLSVAGFAVAIAVVRIRPIWSIVLVGALLAVQVLYWPTRFGQTSWIAYFMLPAVAFGIGLYATTLSKRILTLVLTVYAVVVAALLTFPSLSSSGLYGTTNGKSWESVEIAQSFASSTVVGILLGLAAWRLGNTLRRHRTTGTPDVRATGVDDSAQAATPDCLSPREAEIYRLVVSGLSNREIAAKASIEESTVKSHVSSVLTKLNVRSRAQLIALHREPLKQNLPASIRSAVGD